MGRRRPRNGPAGKPGGSSKAGKLPKLKDKKKPAAPQAQGDSPGDSGSGSGGGPPPPAAPRRRKQRAPWWSFVGLVAGLASLYVYVTGQQRKQKRTRDRGVLQGMLRRPLKYTEHAACRMDCRFISKEEVLETLSSGSVNDRKSRPRLQPCPKYVVDARVGPKGKNVQAVFSACTDATNVVTVIDRDTNWPCPPC